MVSIDTLHEKINLALAEIPHSNRPPELYKPINYSLSMGGKRMRPLLCMMACEMFGKEPETSLQAALGIEIFHNFTLLHDDIMDNSPKRRGKTSVYKKWNTNIAILSGDTMFALAYDCLLKTESPYLSKVLKVFNKTAIEVCEGQQMDMNFETSDNVKIADYIDMIRLKTAVLLGASLKIGGIIGGANTQDLDHLYHFGVQLGLSFQLKDDLLDVYGDEEKFGKVSGGDINANKKTYLFLKALEEAKGELHSKLLTCYSNSDLNLDTKVKEVKEIYDHLDIKAFTEKEIERYYLEAISHLDHISVPEEQKESLRTLALKLFKREK
ncbi:polyprenyl synthetase family protein [candidate division KSB1 bacterium]